jgi:hypothetical protein
MSTPWPDRSMADRSLRVAMSGVVHNDDPTIIADMQNEIDRLRAELAETRKRLDEMVSKQYDLNGEPGVAI